MFFCFVRLNWSSLPSFVCAFAYFQFDHFFGRIIHRHATNDIIAIVRSKALFFSLPNELYPSLICFYVTLLHAFHLHIIDRVDMIRFYECVLNGFIQMAMGNTQCRVSVFKIEVSSINHYQPKILKSKTKSKPTWQKCINGFFFFFRIYHRSSSLIVVISVQTFCD